MGDGGRGGGGGGGLEAGQGREATSKKDPDNLDQTHNTSLLADGRNWK